MVCSFEICLEPLTLSGAGISKLSSTSWKLSNTLLAGARIKQNHCLAQKSNSLFSQRPELILFSQMAHISNLRKALRQMILALLASLQLNIHVQSDQQRLELIQAQVNQISWNKGNLASTPHFLFFIAINYKKLTFAHHIGCYFAALFTI